MKYLPIIFIGFFFSFQTFAQIDLNSNLLKSKNLTDKQRVKLYLDQSKAYWGEQLDSSAMYAEKAYELATKINSKADIANALIRKGIVSNNNDQDSLAMQQFRQALKIAQKQGLKEIEAAAYYEMGQAFRNAPDSSFQQYEKSIKLAKSIGNSRLVLKNNIKKVRLLLHQKNHKELSKLFDTIIPQLQKTNDIDGLAETFTYMSLTFRDLNEKEKSLYYAEKALELTPNIRNKKLNSFIYGTIATGVIGYFENSEKVKTLINKSIELSTQINDQAYLKVSQKRLAIIYENEKDYKSAEKIVNQLLPGSKDPDLYKQKATLFYNSKKYKEAIPYFDKAYEIYAREKAYMQQEFVIWYKIVNKTKLINDMELQNDFLKFDSLTKLIHNTESKNQFFDLETKYRTAEKEAEIQQKELELIQSHNRIIIISAISILLLGSGGFGIWYMRNRQRRKELEYTNQLFDLQNSFNAIELSNLNNQLNPHEIKNLITSIAPELITNAPDAYRKMIKLLNVTRASLSNKLTEPLEVQIQQANDYLKLQQSISPYPWEFEIDNQFEDMEIEVPRLLMKNMVENAVKYGMKSRKENGVIRINIDRDSHYLKISILDNGLDNEKCEEEESTGIGFSTYQKLFAFANAYNERKASLELKRVDEVWTSAEITIPLNYKYQ